MVFLNPWFLLGLAAAAIPVLIHLLHVKKLRTVEFSSLRFLKELQKSRLRTVRLRQLLLLLLRTLLIIFLVLAFARPAVRGTFFGMFGGTAARTSLILLDDSPSMSVRDERGVRFEQARQAAQRIAALAGEQDRVIFTTAAPLRTALPSAAPSRSAVERAIAGSAVTVIHVPFAEVLERIRPVLDETPQAEREIFLVTDAQSSQFDLPRDREDVRPEADRLLHATVVQIGSGTPENTGISGVDLESQVLSPNKPLRLRVTLRHSGPTTQRDAFMSVYLDGTRVAQRSVDLPPDLPVTVSVEPLPKRSGPIAGYVQIEDDALEADNTRSFTVRIPDRVNVLAIGESPADTRYPVLALTLHGDSSSARIFRVTAGTRSRLEAFDVRTCDVLLICGVTSVTAAEAAAIARFTSAGGGVILFAPPEADATSFREILLPALGLPRGIRPRTAAGDSSARIFGFVTFSSVDQDHPLLRDLLERTRGGRGSPVPIESPRVTRTFPIPSMSPAQKIIGLSNGEAFLTELPAGKGRLLWFAVDPGIRSSDFPLRGIYAPLLNRAVMYLAGRMDAEGSSNAGQPVVLTPPEGSAEHPEQFSIVAPSGLEEPFTPEPAGTRRKASVRTGPAMELGIYELRDRRNARALPLALAAVTVDTSESDLRPASDSTLSRFWGIQGVAPGNIQRLPADATLEQAVLESRSGTELWRIFAGLALLCALLEMLVARVSRAEVPDA